MTSASMSRFGASVRSLAIALAVGAAVSHAAEDYKQWSGKRVYRINTSATGANWSGTATNFPLLVRIAAGDSVLTQAKADGADLRFTKADSTTRLHHEIETWGPSGAAVWVLIDQVQSNSNAQRFVMHWGKADAADSSRGSAVFSPSNGYVGVWHMNGTANENDATGNGNVATAQNAPGSVAGVIGGARSLARANSQYFIVADHASLNWTSPGLTLSAWVKANDWEGSSRILQKGTETGGNATQYGLRETSLDRLAIDVNGTNLNTAESAVPATEEWALVHAVVDGTTRKLFLNGVEVAAADYPGNDLATTPEPLHIGRGSGSPNLFNGILDEVRVQSAGRSAEWIALEYENQKTGQTLVQIVTGDVTGVAGNAARGAASFAATAQGKGVLFRVPDGTGVAVTVTDMRGQVVWKGSFNGARELAWNGENAANGLYVARLVATDGQGRMATAERRITLAR